MAQENSSSYYPLLDRVASGDFASAKTDKELYDRVLRLLAEDGYLSADSLSTFKLALSMRTATPRIEAHYQYYETAVSDEYEVACDTWVARDGRRYCTEELSDGTPLRSE